MSKYIKGKIEQGIEVLADKIKGDVKDDAALRYTQAMLNLLHALRLWRCEAASPIAPLASLKSALKHAESDNMRRFLESEIAKCEGGEAS